MSVGKTLLSELWENAKNSSCFYCKSKNVEPIRYDEKFKCIHIHCLYCNREFVLKCTGEIIDDLEDKAELVEKINKAFEESRKMADECKIKPEDLETRVTI